jgi:hypothetical protein
VAKNDAAQRARIRKAIHRYVRRHPLAGDTVGGIVTRWLPRRGFESAPDHIGRVLEEMVADGMLQSRPLPDGGILYRARGKAPAAPDGGAKRRARRARR